MVKSVRISFAFESLRMKCTLSGCNKKLVIKRMKNSMNHLLEQIKRNNASAFTHSGKFHADGVFSAALLQYLNPEISITKGNKVPDSAIRAAFL